MNATDATAASAAQAAVAVLRDQARHHKRLAQQHRRRSAEIMTKVDEIKRNCAAVGITIEPEAVSHGHPEHHPHS